MSANTARSVKCVLSASEPLSQLTTTHTAWFDQRRKKVDQSLRNPVNFCPVCGTGCVKQRLDEARGQIELSEARGLGHRAIIVSRVFPQSSHITPIQPLRASQAGYLGPQSGHGSKGRWIKLDVATRNRGYSRGNQGRKWVQGRMI